MLWAARGKEKKHLTESANGNSSECIAAGPRHLLQKDGKKGGVPHCLHTEYKDLTHHSPDSRQNPTIHTHTHTHAKQAESQLRR